MTSFSDNTYAPLTAEIMQSWRKQQERKLGRAIEAHEYNPAFTKVITALEESGGSLSAVPPEFRQAYEQENSKVTERKKFTRRFLKGSKRPPLKSQTDPRKKVANRKKNKAARSMRKQNRRK